MDRNTPRFHQLSGWLFSEDPTGEESGYGGHWLAWLHGRTAKFYKTMLEEAYSREINITFSGNSSGGIFLQSATNDQSVYSAS
jgi:hypothetical protein